MNLTFSVLPAGMRHEQMVFIAVQTGSCSCADSVWKLAHSPHRMGTIWIVFFYFLVGK